MKRFYRVKGEIWTDVNSQARELWVVAGPRAFDGDNIHHLPVGFRLVAEREFRSAWPLRREMADDDVDR